jgi:fucose 4-O-acetylase-like acetyltransferase
VIAERRIDTLAASKLEGVAMSVWSQAQGLAERTPDTRNRYVDFLRAASIAVVVAGHWLMAAAYTDGDTLELADMLHVSPWTQWLSWAFQVMPLFFIVGGYANAVSWESARRKGEPYGAWVATRLRRLVGPVVPLLIVWSAMAATAHRFGVHPEMIKVGSQVALIPTWFLAVYVMVVLVNGTIMTLYLWHVTAMVLMIGLANLLGGAGLGFVPGTSSWWATRPIWIALLACALSVFVALFGRFEQTARAGAATPLAAWRGIIGAAGVCVGLTVLALNGIGAEGVLGIRIGSVLIALAGAALILAAPLRRSTAT